MEEIWKEFARRGRGKLTKLGQNHFVIWEVSNLGRVRKTSNKTGKVTIVKQQLCGGGVGNRYPSLPLNDFKYVHRLVALNFVPNPNPSKFTVVDHIDKNRQNNHWTNLQWVTPSDNVNKDHRVCPHCGKEGYGNAFGNHILWCLANPHRGLTRAKKLKLGIKI